MKKAKVVIIDGENEVPCSLVEFLMNEGNKMQLICLICQHLVCDG